MERWTSGLWKWGGEAKLGSPHCEDKEMFDCVVWCSSSIQLRKWRGKIPQSLTWVRRRRFWNNLAGVLTTWDLTYISSNGNNWRPVKFSTKNISFDSAHVSLATSINSPISGPECGHHLKSCLAAESRACNFHILPQTVMLLPCGSLLSHTTSPPQCQTPLWAAAVSSFSHMAALSFSFFTSSLLPYMCHPHRTFNLISPQLSK